MTYTIEGFLEKNKDLLFKDLSQAMYACERKLLKELFPEGETLEEGFCWGGGGGGGIHDILTVSFSCYFFITRNYNIIIKR